MKIFLCVITLLFSNACFSQINLALKYFLEDNHPDEQIVSVAIKGDHDPIIKYCLEKQISVTGKTHNYYYLTISKKQLKDLSRQSFIRYIDFNLSRAFVLNDSARVINNVEPIHNNHPDLLQAYTGNGILMGVIDGGIDFTHGDFLFADSSTRVIKYWKQHAPFNAALTPSEFGYGQEYDSSMINNGSVSLNSQAIDHGSTVTGSAAGNANANGRHKGMAPESDLIIVSSNLYASNWKSTIADAVQYIVNVADSLEKPVVINASLGDYLGSHDGLDPTALRIDSILNAKPGRIMVCAAGNSGAQPAYHLKRTSGTDTTYTWFTYNSSLATGFAGYFLELWADTSNLNQLKLGLAFDKTSGNFERRGQSAFHNLSGNLNAIVPDIIWSSSGDTLANVELYMEQRDGQYRLQIAIPDPDSSQYNLALLSTGLGNFDLWSASWLGLNDMVINVPDTTILPSIANYNTPDTLSTIVDSWACSPSVVTVGNFYSRLSYYSYANTIETVPGTKGAISISSSKGPNRQGVMKPNIAATGDMSLSAASMSSLSYYQANDPTKLDSAGLHIRNGGTSMASPMVAGIAALYLEKCPGATMNDFLTALESSGRSDPYTGNLPNYAFGYGKADGLATLKYSNFSPTISGTPYFCESDSTLLQSSSHDSIIWFNESNNPGIYVNVDTTVYLTAYNSQGCKAISDTLFVFKAPYPPLPTITHISNSLTSSPAFDYQWYLNGTILPGETGQQHLVSSAGYYQVKVTNQYGCTNISDSLFISPTGINKQDDHFSVYPNPFKNILQLNGDSDYNYIITNALGKIVSKGHENGRIKLNTSRFTPGLYFLTVENTDKMWTYRIIKQ